MKYYHPKKEAELHKVKQEAMYNEEGEIINDQDCGQDNNPDDNICEE